ncbi:hypothetical protein GTY65_34050 [Streptomyces sp. SID8379]|uniref:RNA polymerase sigma factor n=1 Tax=unclassified Streptomyces TaxID=2593676 RepID=UPI0003723822|nr:sigma-70 family RNA polymerase sigma factor [Streptomyces sp. HmicA12]MYW69060.1 hypothetical protein [Streptomyces sp. SID8379]
MTSEAPRTPDEFNAFFRAKYALLVARLQRFARARGIELNQYDAEAVVSVAFKEMADDWPQVRDPMGYVWHRTGLRLMDHLRSCKREVELCDPGQRLAHMAGAKDFEPEAHVDAWDMENHIGQLSGREQRILQLYAQGYSKAEQAEALNVTPGNAGVILFRAKQKLMMQQGRQGQR